MRICASRRNPRIGRAVGAARGSQAPSEDAARLARQFFGFSAPQTAVRDAHRTLLEHDADVMLGRGRGAHRRYGAVCIDAYTWGPSRPSQAKRVVTGLC